MGILRVAIFEARPLPITLTFLSVLIGGLLAWRLGYQPAWDGLILGALAAMLLNWADHPLDTLVDYFWRREYDYGYRSRFGDAGVLLMRGEASKSDLIGSWAILFSIAVPMLVYAISRAPVWFLPTVWAIIGVGLSVLYAVGGLDKTPAGDFMFAIGVLSALFGGYFLVASEWSIPIIVLATLLLILVFSALLIDRLPDTHDIRIGKRTIPTIIGYDNAKKLAYGLAFTFSALLIILHAAGALPWVALASALAPIPIWIYSYRLDPHSAEVPFFIGALETAIPLLLFLAFG